MQSFDVIAQFGVWLWFALAVVLFVLESIVPGVHFVWFGVSAAVVGVIALLAPMAVAIDSFRARRVGDRVLGPQ